MRIIIETDGQQQVLYQQPGLTEATDEQSAAEDAGPPGNELLEAIDGSEQTEEQPQASPGGDAGAAPDWLVSVVEGGGSAH